MPDEESSEGAAKMVSVEDFNSLKSSVEAQMESMKKMIAELLAPALPKAPSVEVKDTGALDEGEASDLPSSTKPVEGDNLNTIKSPIASPRGT